MRKYLIFLFVTISTTSYSEIKNAGFGLGFSGFKNEYSISICPLLPVTKKYFIIAKFANLTQIQKDVYNNNTISNSIFFPLNNIIQAVFFHRNALGNKIHITKNNILPLLLPQTILNTEHHFIFSTFKYKKSYNFFTGFLASNLNYYKYKKVNWTNYKLGLGLTFNLNFKTKKENDILIMFSASADQGIVFVNNERNYQKIQPNFGMKVFFCLKNDKENSTQ